MSVWLIPRLHKRPALSNTRTQWCTVLHVVCSTQWCTVLSMWCAPHSDVLCYMCWACGVLDTVMYCATCVEHVVCPCILYVYMGTLYVHMQSSLHGGKNQFTLTETKYWQSIKCQGKYTAEEYKYRDYRLTYHIVWTLPEGLNRFPKRRHLAPKFIIITYVRIWDHLAMLPWLHNHHTILCKYVHPLRHILTNVHIMYCYFCVCTLCCVCIYKI